MKKIIFLIFFIIIIPFTLAVEECNEDEKYSVSKGECIPICTESQDYVNGECLPKCRELEHHIWDVEEQGCVSMCVLDPNHYFCKNDSSTDKESFFDRVKNLFFKNSADKDINDMIKSCKKDSNLCKAVATAVSGKVLYERGLDILPVEVGYELLPGDTIVVDDNSSLTLHLREEKTIVLDKKTKFTIPSGENAAARTSKITLFFGNIWVKTKNIFGGDEEEYVKTPTTVAGVRG